MTMKWLLDRLREPNTRAALVTLGAAALGSWFAADQAREILAAALVLVTAITAGTKQG